MNLKVKYLDIRQIKNLRRNLEYIGSDEIKNELDEHINSTSDGAYLINLLSERSFKELVGILENYSVPPFSI